MLSLEERLAALEQSNRRWKWIVSLWSCLFLSAALLGAGVMAEVPEVVRAKSFGLMDGKGMGQGEWLAAEDGCSLNFFKDKDKDKDSYRLKLYSFKGSTGLFLADDKGFQRINLQVTPDKQIMNLENKEGQIIWQAQ